MASLFSVRSLEEKRPVTESLAIAISVSQWTKASAESSIQVLFRSKQSWIRSLIENVFQQHPDRIPLQRLIRTLSQNVRLREVIKRRNIKPLDISRVMNGKSVASLDWNLPQFENARQMAGQFGISLRCLEWLSGRQLPPDKRPRHYVTTWIPKRHDGFRLIESPKAKLKNAQQTILRDILNLMPPHLMAHGFRKGRDVVSFVESHIAQPFCLRMDLKDFFPAVTGGRVFGIFRRAGYGHDIAKVLANVCTTQTHNDIVELQRPAGQTGSFRASMLYLPSHLPQGAPTSPALANLAAYTLDCRLTGLAESLGISYSRYADDMLFSGDLAFAKSAKKFSICVGAIAIEEGFEVNFRKTRFQNSSQRQSATGVVLNRKPNLERREYDRLKATLHNCVKLGPEPQNRNHHANFQQHLIGKINWVQRLNPARARKLLRLFEQIEWTTD